MSCVHFRKLSTLSTRNLPKRLPIPGVKYVVLVSSGKGGVGKSTVAVNLALALNRVQPYFTVGLLDADIYGPSIPLLLDLVGERPQVNQQNIMLPLSRFGLQVMSMGFLTDYAAPIIWRGLMVMNAIQRLLRNVAWGPLDVLIVDMPPGTGDVQLSISQNIPVSGAVLVTTPQDLALVDSRKGAEMYAKVQIPVLGVVLNMSYYQCSACEHREDLFGSSAHAEKLADSYGSQLIGSVPLIGAIAASSDSGKPMVVASPNSPPSEIYFAMAARLSESLVRLTPLTD